jgi:hypothetical protein
MPEANEMVVGRSLPGGLIVMAAMWAGGHGQNYKGQGSTAQVGTCLHEYRPAIIV